MSDDSVALGQCLSYLSQVSDVIVGFSQEQPSLNAQFDQQYDSACSLHIPVREEGVCDVVCPSMNTLVPSIGVFLKKTVHILKESPLPMSVLACWKAQKEQQVRMDTRLEAQYSLALQKYTTTDLIPPETLISACTTVNRVLLDVLAHVGTSEMDVYTHIPAIQVNIVANITKLAPSPLLYQRMYAHLDVANISKSTDTPSLLQPVTVFEMQLPQEHKIQCFTPKPFHQNKNMDLLKLIIQLRDNKESKKHSSSGSDSNNNNTNNNNDTSHNNTNNSSNNSNNNNNTNNNTNSTISPSPTRDKINTGLIISIPSPPLLRVKPFPMHLLTMIASLLQQLVQNVVNQQAIQALSDQRMACCAQWRLLPLSLSTDASITEITSILTGIQSMLLIFAPTATLTMKEAALLRLPGVLTIQTQTALYNTYTALLTHYTETKQPIPRELVSLAHWCDGLTCMLEQPKAWLLDFNILYATSISPCHMFITITHLLTVSLQSLAKPGHQHLFVPLLQAILKVRSNHACFPNIPFLLRCIHMYYVASWKKQSTDLMRSIDPLLSAIMTQGTVLVKYTDTSPNTFLSTSCTLLACLQLTPKIPFDTENQCLPVFTAVLAHPKSNILHLPRDISIHGNQPGQIPASAPYIFPETQFHRAVTHSGGDVSLASYLFGNICILTSMLNFATTNITAMSCIALLPPHSVVTLAFQLGSYGSKPAFTFEFPENILHVLKQQVFTPSLRGTAPSAVMLSVSRCLQILTKDTPMHITKPIQQYLTDLFLFLIDPVWALQSHSGNQTDFKKSLSCVLLLPTAIQLSTTLQHTSKETLVHSIPGEVFTIAQAVSFAMQKIYLFPVHANSFAASFYTYIYLMLAEFTVKLQHPSAYQGTVPHPVTIAILMELQTYLSPFLTTSLNKQVFAVLDYWVYIDTPALQSIKYPTAVTEAILSCTKAFIQGVGPLGSILIDTASSTQCGSVIPTLQIAQVNAAMDKVCQIHPIYEPACKGLKQYMHSSSQATPLPLLTLSGLVTPLTVYPALPTLPATKISVYNAYIEPNQEWRLKLMEQLSNNITTKDKYAVMYVLAHYACVCPSEGLVKMACITFCKTIPAITADKTLTHVDRTLCATLEVQLAHIGVTVKPYLLSAILETICESLPSDHPIQLKSQNMVIARAVTLQRYTQYDTQDNRKNDKNQPISLNSIELLCIAVQLLAYTTLTSAYKLVQDIKLALLEFPPILFQVSPQQFISLQSFAKQKVKSACLMKKNSHMLHILRSIYVDDI